MTSSPRGAGSCPVPTERASSGVGAAEDGEHRAVGGARPRHLQVVGVARDAVVVRRGEELSDLEDVVAAVAARVGSVDVRRAGTRPPAAPVQVRLFLRYLGRCAGCARAMTPPASTTAEEFATIAYHPGMDPVTARYAVLVRTDRVEGRGTPPCGACAPTGERRVDPYLCGAFRDPRLSTASAFATCDPIHLDCLWLRRIANLSIGQVAAVLGLGIEECRAHETATVERIGAVVGVSSAEVERLLKLQRPLPTDADPGGSGSAGAEVPAPGPKHLPTPRDQPPEVRRAVVFELQIPDELPVPVQCELSYTVQDPYAVQVWFRVGRSSRVEWVFARDLLADGLRGPSGDGDVQVRPEPQSGDRRAEVELSSPSGHAVFTAPADALRDFLDGTYHAVPAGSEDEHVDVDQTLRRLLPGPEE